MKTPADILEKFELAAIDLDYGSVTLTLFIKNGKKRFVVSREESFVSVEEPISFVASSQQSLKTLTEA